MACAPYAVGMAEMMLQVGGSSQRLELPSSRPAAAEAAAEAHMSRLPAASTHAGVAALPRRPPP